MTEDKLTWKDVLDSSKRRWGDRDLFYVFVRQSGYDYFEWNGRIYKAVSVNYYYDTGLTTDDLN